MSAVRRHATLAALALVIVLTGRLLASAVEPSGQASRDARVRVEMQTGLRPMRGDHLRATLVEVTYPPGGSSPAHSHSCPLVGRVIDGALHTRVAGGPDTVYHAGESFREEAGEAHVVSSNASDLAPVTFLVWFVCDGEGPRTIALASGATR